jgi:hypothetical protein
MQFSPQKPNLAPFFNTTSQMAPPADHSFGFESFPSNNKLIRANLLGLIPFFKFPSFPAIQWPDDSFRTWFKAHGSAPLIQEVSSFSAFSGFHSGNRKIQAFVSSHSPPLSAPQLPLPSPTVAGPSEASIPTMANIPIDPKPFVPHNFQIQHITGRVATKWVVVLRRPREHEQYVIATIHPFLEGLVLFDNVRDGLWEYLTEVARVGFVSLQSCPFGAAYVQFRNVSDRDILISSCPNQFGDVIVSFVKHDEGSSWRGLLSIEMSGCS